MGITPQIKADWSGPAFLIGHFSCVNCWYLPLINNYEHMLQEQARTCGTLDGGSGCRLLILRNANGACLCHLFMPMSHVEFKKWYGRI